MKMTRMVLVWGVWFTLFGGTVYAEASVLGWPVISQVKNVVFCVVSDAGKITTSLVTHATGFATETLKTIGDCLIYVAGQVTGTPDPNPLHTDVPHA